MKIIRSIKEISNFSQRSRLSRKTIGFVPTMGVLHAGHLSLIRKAHLDNDLVVVSIFVNPTQFGRGEDFKKYPRNLSQDTKLCKKEGVDIIFYPDAKEMYPSGYKTFISVSELSERLCGKFRLGHFKGVATVVFKLFNIVQPDIAYFGQKDAQQAIIIKKIVEDLNLRVKIKVMSTVRQNDGLALSSRNKYLKPREKKDALVLRHALNLAENLIKKGVTDSNKIIRNMQQLIKTKKNAKIDYISVVDLEKLRPIKRLSRKYLIALAVWIGKTRLIDNIIIGKINE